MFFVQPSGEVESNNLKYRDIDYRIYRLLAIWFCWMYRSLDM